MLRILVTLFIYVIILAILYLLKPNKRGGKFQNLEIYLKLEIITQLLLPTSNSKLTLLIPSS